MKTQFYGAVKCLNIKMTKFQKHYLVLSYPTKFVFLMFGSLVMSENLSFVPIILLLLEG